MWAAPLVTKVPAELHATVRFSCALLVINFLLTNLMALPESVLRGMNLGYKRMGLQAGMMVKSWNPDFVITLGDNNYPDGEAGTIDKNIGKYYHEFIHPYTGAYGAGATANRFWPCLGNHDLDNRTGPDGQPYLDYFALPNNERYYDFVRGPVHFFVLNSDTREPDGASATSVQAQWLQGRLAASTAPWKLVYFHHPAYSSRTSYTNMRWPFKAWGANAVFAGHAHVYERVLVDGFPYFTNGLGGESTGSFSQAVEGSMFRYGTNYGAMRVNAGADVITFEFFTVDGVARDTYTINRHAPVPDAPSGLAGAAVSTSQIDLSWTDNAAGEDGFKVERSTNGTTFTRIATVGPNINAYTNIGLQPSTTYYYRVRAFTYDKNSAYSNTVSVNTTGLSPAAPGNLAATPAHSTRIDLSWADNSNNENEFQIERCAGAGCADFLQIAEVNANVTTYGDAGVSTGVTYGYRVRAVNGSGDSNYSNVASATTAAPPQPPAPPTSLTAAAPSHNQVNLVWADNSDNEGGFRVERCTGAGCTNFAEFAAAGANATGHADPGRAGNTTYEYRVRAFNSVGNSGYSNVVSATTFPPAIVPPGAPTNLVATAVSGAQINLTWTDNANNETGFKLYRSTNGSSYTEIAKPGANASGYADTGRSPSTTYYYRIRSYNAAGNSVCVDASATTQ